ncbi:hypothetical protein PsorP6_002714 [Peronosclerospora sorghi]|uniref:Uncharacterized protein n=1 Tax=Peronosclerospora sorghi TaxID=230839 RepID=A0ACC0WZ69_9STRA|nr:hypothetical protein PsorP6_002714 [Peronosclerospora sorghi]
MWTVGAGGWRMRREKGDGDEAASVASIETRETIMSDGGDFYDGYSNDLDDEQQIDEAIENLTEERTTTRIAALENLTSYLLQYMAPKDVKDSFVNNVFGCLRKPSEAEILLGSRILTIMAIIFGGNEERFLQRSKATLQPLMKRARNGKVKTATIRALALICFVCSVEEENTEELLKLFETYFDSKISGDVCKAALDSWVLVASSLSDEIIASEEEMERLVPKLLVLLSHNDVDVRSAAGENVAFLYESAQNCCVSIPCKDEILERFLEMSKSNNKKNSKKDRKTQRVVFRDINSTFVVGLHYCEARCFWVLFFTLMYTLFRQTGETPHISFAVKGEMLEIRSWRSVKQFEAFKDCLQSGLQNHIKYNSVLREILDLPDTLEDRKVDRRDIFDKKSTSRKKRSNKLNGDRLRKCYMHNVFYDG